MGASRVEVPATIPQWGDQNLYKLLYPRGSLFTDIQGLGRLQGREPLYEDRVINLYQDHMAQAIDVSDLMTAMLIFWRSAPTPIEYRRGYPMYTDWESIGPHLEPFQTYVVDGRCHIT